MSGENVEIVRRTLEHFVATDEFLTELLAPDFVWDMGTFEGWPEEPEYTGPDELRGFLTLWREPWDDWTMQLDEVHDCGNDRVLALAHQSGKPHGRIQLYATLDEARETAGLSA